MREIKKQAFWGIIFRGGYHAFHQIASLIVKVILVKFLLPADFGLLAMAMIVFTSLDIINRFAQGEPFIRDNTSDPNKAKNVIFYMTSVFQGATALVTFFSASYVALFFANKMSDGQSITTLIWVIRILALRPLFSIVSAVPLAILNKDLRFKELYTSTIVGTAAYAITAPILAFLGFGIWAIVLAHLLEQIVVTIILLFYAPFFPSLTFDKQIVKKYISYNSNIFVNSILLIIITNGDDTIIGRLMGPSVLGFYNIGQQFAMLVTLLISTNLTEIIFPVLSTVQQDRELYNRVFFKAFRLTTFFTIPFIGVSLILGKQAVLSVFGERWLPIVPVFYVLSVSALFESLILIFRPVFGSLNKPQIFRNGRLIGAICFVVLVYPLARVWGYLGICWVMVIISAASIIYLAPKIANEIDGFYDYALGILVRTVTCTLVMMGVLYVSMSRISVNLAWLFMFAVAGIVLYFVPMLFIDKELKRDLRDTLTILGGKVGVHITT